VSCKKLEKRKRRSTSKDKYYNEKPNGRDGFGGQVTKKNAANGVPRFSAQKHVQKKKMRQKGELRLSVADTSKEKKRRGPRPNPLDRKVLRIRPPTNGKSEKGKGKSPKRIAKATPSGMKKTVLSKGRKPPPAEKEKSQKVSKGRVKRTRLEQHLRHHIWIPSRAFAQRMRKTCLQRGHPKGRGEIK